MPTVAITLSSPTDLQNAKYINMLREHGFGIKVIDDERFARGNATETEEIEVLDGVQAVIAAGERYSRSVIEALPELRVVARLGVGFDRVDIPAATSNDLVVTITPNSNHEAVSEHAMSLMLATAKSIHVRDKNVRDDRWISSPSIPLRGQTLGIIGLGRIGRDMAVRAGAFRMNILAVEPMVNATFNQANNIDVVEMETLLENSDFVSLHCDLSEATEGLIDYAKLQLMKNSAILINTARGGLIVEDDLIKALQTKEILGAGLDVFESEPCRSDHPFYDMENVILSPHMAGTDHLSLEEMGIEAAQCIIDLYKGNWPGQCVVNGDLKKGWDW